MRKIKIILPIILIIAAVIAFWINTRFWNGKDKVSVVETSSDGGVRILVYDPELSELVNLVIPGDTEVSVARELGTLRLKNVWQLGLNEKIGGKLLTETITKNFLFPVFLFVGPDGSTNIPFGDRFLMWFFEKRTKNLQETEIDLGKSQFVKKTKLSDGEVGYKIPGSVSERLTVYFADNEMSAALSKVYIKDATGAYGVAENVGRVVEVMGGKIVTIEKAESEDSDCVATGNFAKKITRVFDCKVGKDKFDPDLIGVDIELILGSQFAKRF